MAKKLSKNNNSGSKGSRLANSRSKPFRLSISSAISNKFNFSKLNRNSGYKKLQTFVDETIKKGLTISETENQFLRKRKKVVRIENINGNEQEIIHFGKDKDPFRIFGYYDENDYFAITAIDTNHKVHKE